MTEQRYMDVPTCAVYIGRTPMAVYQLVSKLQIPHIKIGRRVQFDKEKLDNWMQRRSRRSFDV